MNKRISLLVVASALCAAGIAAGQGQIMDMVAKEALRPQLEPEH